MSTQTLLQFAPPKNRRLRLERRRDGWWVVGLPDAADPEIGPYCTKPEADEARAGMVRFFTTNPSYADWPIASGKVDK